RVKEAESFGVVATSQSFDEKTRADLTAQAADAWEKVDPKIKSQLDGWQNQKQRYQAETFSYPVRDRDVTVTSRFTTLSQLSLPKISLPPYLSKTEVCRYLIKENTPGSF